MYHMDASALLGLSHEATQSQLLLGQEQNSGFLTGFLVPPRAPFILFAGTQATHKKSGSLSLMLRDFLVSDRDNCNYNSGFLIGFPLKSSLRPSRLQPKAPLINPETPNPKSPKIPNPNPKP